MSTDNDNHMPFQEIVLEWATYIVGWVIVFFYVSTKKWNESRHVEIRFLYHVVVLPVYAWVIVQEVTVYLSNQFVRGAIWCWNTTVDILEYCIPRLGRAILQTVDFIVDRFWDAIHKILFWVGVLVNQWRYVMYRLEQFFKDWPLKIYMMFESAVAWFWYTIGRRALHGAYHLVRVSWVLLGELGAYLLNAWYAFDQWCLDHVWPRLVALLTWAARLPLYALLWVHEFLGLLGRVFIRCRNTLLWLCFCFWYLCRLAFEPLCVFYYDYWCPLVSLIRDAAYDSWHYALQAVYSNLNNTYPNVESVKQYAWHYNEGKIDVSPVSPLPQPKTTQN